jgi:hypothetical protein
MIRHCSQLRAISLDIIENLRKELVGAGIAWSENYSKYHSGGWKTAALFNASGDSKDNDLEDCSPVPTELADRLPLLRSFLEVMDLELMWARILKLEPGACLWEHTDYGAPHLKRAPRLRLHIPLQTDEAAVIVLPSHVFHLKRGFVWKLCPDETRHGACNDGTEDRIHVIVDCYVDDRLRSLLACEILDPNTVREKPALTLESLLALEAKADEFLNRGQLEDAETTFKKAFQRFDLGALSSYDLLISFFDRRGHKKLSDHWSRERTFFLNTDVPGHPFFGQA